MVVYAVLCSMMQSGRLCVVLPASQQGPPKGILLGTSPGRITAWHFVRVQVIQDLGLQHSFL